MKDKILAPFKAVWWLLQQPFFWWSCLVFAICLLIWFAGPGLAIFSFNPLASAWVRLLCIFLVLVFCGYRLFGVQIKQWVQGRKFHQTEADQLAHKPLPKSSRRRLKKQFAELVQFLKSASSDRLKRVSLYDLPWFLVIGPAQSGKESLLKAAQIDFSYMSRHQQQEKSDSFDWWVSEHAVFISVAAPLFEQAVPRADQQWKYLLKLLKKARPRRPLNGVLLVLGLQSLLSQEVQGDKDSSMVQQGRLRLQELQTKLGIYLPTYVFVNQADCLAGFSTYFSDYTERQRQQVFGMTFPDNTKRDQEHPADLFSYYFDDLVASLHHRVLTHMGQEFNTQQNTTIYQFPMQFSGTKAKLSEVVRGIFSHRRFFHLLRLRGIYFTSAQQGSQLVDVVLGEQSASKLPAVRSRNKYSYFVASTFNQLLIPEAELVGVNKRYERRWNLWRRVRLLAILSVCAVVVLAWVFSFVQHVHYQDQISLMSQQYSKLPAIKPVATNFSQHYPRLNLLGQMAHLPEDMPASWSLRLGLYEDQSPYQAVNTWYQRQLNQQFLPYVMSSLHQGLTSALAEPDGTGDAYSRLHKTEVVYHWLSSYLMFAQPKHRNPAEIVQTLGGWWKKQYTGDRVQQEWLDMALVDVLQADIPVQTVDMTLVRQAREVLWHSPIYLQAYVNLKTHLTQANQAHYTLASDNSVDDSQVFSLPVGGVTVPELFTKEGDLNGYEKRSGYYLKQASQAQWVMGDEYRSRYSSDDLKSLKQQMTALYWRDYLTAWDNALSQLNIAPFDNLSQAINNLSVLTQHNSPMVQVLERVQDNTSWSGGASRLFHFGKPKSSVFSKMSLGATDNIIDNHFAPLNAMLTVPDKGQAPIYDVLQSLANLQQYLNKIANSSNPPLVAYQESLGIFQGKPNDAIALVKQEIDRVPTPVSKWLQQILNNSYRAIFDQANIYLSQQWQSQVAVTYQQTLAGRFPMDKDAQQTANIGDFINFFKVGGVEDQFFTTNLSPFMTEDASGNLIWAQISGVPFSTNAQVANAINIGHKIAQTFFSGPQGNQIEVTLKPQTMGGDVSKVLITYNGTTNSSSRDMMMTFTWPATEDGSVTLLLSGGWTGSDITTNYIGPWGLFYLFSNSTRTCVTSGVCTVTFGSAGHQATFMLNATTVNDPFDLTLLQQYQFPTQFHQQGIDDENE